MIQNEAISILRPYGLTEVLTDRDDPTLWAAVLLKYWPTPNAAEFDVWGYALEWDASSLFFAIGRPKTSIGAIAMIEVTDGWCFERVDATHLRVKSCEEREATFGDLSASLVITRPSRGQSNALAHFGVVLGPRSGHGAMYQWNRQGEGLWVEEKLIFEYVL